MAAAAAAWLSFADASGSALAAAGGSAAMARLPGNLAGAVDGITAHGLAPLVPAQLLSAAVAALRERVARLQAALGPVSATLEAAAAAEAGVDEEDGEQAAALPAELEDALAEALRVRVAGAWVLSPCPALLLQGWPHVPAAGRPPFTIRHSPCMNFCHSVLPPKSTELPAAGGVRGGGGSHAAAVAAVRARAPQPASAGGGRPRGAAGGGATLSSGGCRRIGGCAALWPQLGGCAAVRGGLGCLQANADVPEHVMPWNAVAC